MKSQLFFLALCIVCSAILVQTNDDDDDDDYDEFTMLQKVMGTKDNMEPAETLATLRKLQTIYAQQLNANKDDIVAKVTGALMKEMLEPSEIKEENCNEAFFKGLDEKIENMADQSKHNMVKYLRDCKAKQLKRCASPDGTNEEGQEEAHSEQVVGTEAEADKLTKTLLYERDDLKPKETVAILRRLSEIYSDRLKADEDDIKAEVVGGAIRDWLEPSKITTDNCNTEYLDGLDELIEHQSRLSRHNLLRYFKYCKAKQLKMCEPDDHKENYDDYEDYDDYEEEEEGEEREKVILVPRVNLYFFLNMLYSEEKESEPEETLKTLKVIESVYHAKSVHQKDSQAKIMQIVFEGWIELSQISEANCNRTHFKRLGFLIAAQTEKKHQNLKRYFNDCRRRQLEMCESVGKPIDLPDETTTNAKQQVLA